MLNVTPDGDYKVFAIPCGCGGICVYVPKSCACFDPDVNKEIARVLEKLYRLAKSMGGGKETTKELGQYDVLTLECGCALKVYVPGSSSCLEKKYPLLGEALKDVYKVAKKQQAKD
jgi:hypothetical protein